jgi:hypothetical protein
MKIIIVLPSCPQGQISLKTRDVPTITYNFLIMTLTETYMFDPPWKWVLQNIDLEPW